MLELYKTLFLFIGVASNLRCLKSGAEPGGVEGGQFPPLARQKNSKVAFKF